MNGPDPLEVTQDQEGNPILSDDSTPSFMVKNIGRYRVQRLLGEGGFGLVYLAYDDQLDRKVAVKVPHPRLIQKSADAQVYLTEARTVAKLNHPHIVPVFDVGATDDFPCYVVSRYVEGIDLSSRIKQKRLNYSDAVELIAIVAEAVHYAHKQGLVHRDLKPGNILIGTDGKPYVVDFGLALTEENIGKGPTTAGTPAYMSPEQARGEGHRVDGRSDVFSLGVVLYQLLSGRRPFRADSQIELLDQVTGHDPRPLRQYDEELPKELERICQKAMAKRASERYSSAHDLAEDLRHLLNQEGVFFSYRQSGALGAVMPPPQQSMGAFVSTQSNSGTSTPAELAVTSNGPQVKIVPKGLRSFDTHDADFFLELLPGPRDRDGLPDSLRFWKSRIEESDADDTFAVGLIYGPSGCGKSSLVKAGLLPRLSDDVVPIYFEATPDGTETRLIHRLHKQFPDLEATLSLKETLAALRRDPALLNGRKLLIVIDQFEQWLHARKEDYDSELVHALRQCDGARVQCVVMVRDDFWLAVTRFLRELEIRLVEGGNSALVDLFDVDHAKKVLAAFGRAFGKLPDDGTSLSDAQKDFLKQSVQGLAEEGKVISVRLALFAEMMKGKTWLSSTLNELGGIKGVGVTFLEETFAAATAPPEHRYHQQAARAVLRHLLPDSGADIKGHMRSHAELLEVSGYRSRPKEFDELVHLLDSEIRLITPTDPEGKEAADGAQPRIAGQDKYYQLAHDYLVHSLRDWLTRKQKETRQGRAELLLQDLAATWNLRPENRFLPAWLENLNIRLFTDRRKWTAPQQAMMRVAARVHGIKTAMALALLAVALLTGLAVRDRVERKQRHVETSRLVQGLLQADTTQVGAIIIDLASYRTEASGDLHRAFLDSPPESNAKLHAALALLPRDPSDLSNVPDDTPVLPFLKDRFPAVSALQFSTLLELLEPYSANIAADYWPIAKDQDRDDQQRFQAACVLANYDITADYWNDKELTAFIAARLVNVPPSELLPWRNALRPIKQHLIEPLSRIYRDDQAGQRARSFASDTLTDYLSDHVPGLFQLLADADADQFSPIFDKINAHADRKLAVAAATAIVDSYGATDSDDANTDLAANRMVNVAAMMLRMEEGQKAWPLLKQSTDPRVRTRLIHGLRNRGVKAQAIADRYVQESDVTVQRALLLCLGQFERDSIPESTRTALQASLLNSYRTHPDAGLHAAAEWMLRKWGQAAQLAAIDEQISQSEQQLQVAKNKIQQWYVNGQHQTYVIVHAGEFTMGSPESEPERKTDESQHVRKINRRLAVCSKEVTKSQWRQFMQAAAVWSADHEQVKMYSKTEDSPIVGITWYEAAGYCNWLSIQEGIPQDQWCYELNDEQQYAAGMKAKERFWELTGYRLPTEAEWEFASRAETTTMRYYGTSEALLGQYAWSLENGKNQVWPVGQLKPNDFGLFDTLGNAFELCYEAYQADPILIDTPMTTPVTDTDRRLVRGGCFFIRGANTRSAQRNANQPGNRDFLNTLRPVRTFPAFE